MKIEVVRGSLLEQDVEVIVNAANIAMRGGGGIDGAIHRAAGPGLLEELEQVAPHGCRTGGVVVTKGHNLPFKHIIHTPGPHWSGGGRDEDTLLASCYSNSLAAAEALHAKTLSFCSVSTGMYRFPLERAAKIALSTVIAYAQDAKDPSIELIRFAMYMEKEYDVYQTLLDNIAGS